MITIYLIRFHTLSGEEARLTTDKNKQVAIASYSRIYEREIRQNIMAIIAQVYYNAHKYLFYHETLGFLAINELPQQQLTELQNNYKQRIKTLLDNIDKKIEVAIDEDAKNVYRQIKQKIEAKLSRPFLTIYKFETDRTTAQQIIEELKEQYEKMLGKYNGNAKGRKKMMLIWIKQKLELLNQLKFIIPSN